MSKLIKFIKGDGTPVLINPDFIQEVSGDDAGSIIVVKREDAEGQFVKHQLPVPVSTVIRMIEEAKD
jgi:hypothetical protein